MMESKRMPVVYVIGPYRGLTAWQVQRNIVAAREVSLELLKLGAAIHCPHANTANFDGEVADEVFLAMDRELLRRSDAAMTVNLWERSTGSIGEVELAHELAIPVFHSVTPRFLEWLSAWKPSSRW